MDVAVSRIHKILVFMEKSKKYKPNRTDNKWIKRCQWVINGNSNRPTGKKLGDRAGLPCITRLEDLSEKMLCETWMWKIKQTGERGYRQRATTNNPSVGKDGCFGSKRILRSVQVWKRPVAEGEVRQTWRMRILQAMKRSERSHLWVLGKGMRPVHTEKEHLRDLWRYTVKERGRSQ